ncbi:hypothetical protein ACO0LF_30895, partial [Undibacterium sp. Di27W]|uniref:hypothetical protein n=1 Tax=Undibacterium sp. Di27W TaxID=3413036 RepID=UPI003BF2FAD4
GNSLVDGPETVLNTEPAPSVDDGEIDLVIAGAFKSQPDPTTSAWSNKRKISEHARHDSASPKTVTAITR